MRSVVIVVAWSVCLSVSVSCAKKAESSDCLHLGCGLIQHKEPCIRCGGPPGSTPWEGAHLGLYQYVGRPRLAHGLYTQRYSLEGWSNAASQLWQLVYNYVLFVSQE